MRLTRSILLAGGSLVICVGGYLLFRPSSFVPRISPAPPSIEIWEETLWQAKDRGFDYTTNLAAAETGDQPALVRLLSFSRVADAAGACGHSAVLYQLLISLGDARFAAAIRATPREDNLLAVMLEAGAEYSGIDRSGSLEAIQAKLSRDFPESYGAAHWHDVPR